MDRLRWAAAPLRLLLRWAVAARCASFLSAERLRAQMLGAIAPMLHSASRSPPSALKCGNVINFVTRESVDFGTQTFPVRGAAAKTGVHPEVNIILYIYIIYHISYNISYIIYHISYILYHISYTCLRRRRCKGIVPRSPFVV